MLFACGLRLFDDRCRAARFFDFVFRGFGKTMRGNFQSLRDFAGSQDNDVVLCLFDQATVVENFGRHFIAGVKFFFDFRQADLEPFFLENICKATLRQTALQRHLSALETRTAAVT